MCQFGNSSQILKIEEISQKSWPKVFSWKEITMW